MQHPGKGYPVSKGKEEFIEFIALIEQGNTENAIKTTKKKSGFTINTFYQRLIM